MTLPSVTDMFAGASVAGTDPFHPSSIFKDPSAAGVAQLTGIHGNLSMLTSVPGLDGGLKTALDGALPSLSSFSSTIVSNTADRVKNIHGDLQAVLSVKNIKSSVDVADGGEHAMDCSMITDIFGSVANIGSMITDTIARMQDALSGVMGDLGDIFSGAMDAISGAALDAINAAAGAITSAMNAVKGLVDDALSGLTDMINAEKAKLAGLMHQMLGFGFLKSLPKLDICGQDVMSTLLDSSKINMSALGSL